MTKTEQRKFVRALTREVRNHLLKTSSQWPAEWDGHELRELIAGSFERERSRLMTEARSQRRREFLRVLLTTNINH